MQLNMVTKSSSTSLMASLADMRMGGFNFTAATQVSNTASQLESLKYVFGMVEMCQGLTTTGSAFSNATNCVTFYSGPTVGDGSSGNITPATLSSYSSSQIDLMDSTSLAKINQGVTITSSQAGDYNYAVINWYTPIEVKGCASSGLCTRSTGATYSGTTTTTTDSLNTSTSQSAIVVSANGGSFFKFQKPFTISADDVKNGTAFTVDLVFDPEAVLAGDSTSGSAGNLHGSGSSINVPMLNIAPVPKKSGDSTKREVYLASDCGSSNAAYRVELYYSSGDSSSVLGATGGFVMDSNTSGFSISLSDLGSKVISIDTATDGSLTLNVPNETTSREFLTGLSRGVNGTFKLDLDYDGTPETSCSYTYVGTTTL